MVFNKAKNLADTLYWELFTIELYILFLLSWPENKDVVILLEKPLNTGEATTVQKGSYLGFGANQKGLIASQRLQMNNFLKWLI